jgi:hypothetical protein
LSRFSPELARTLGAALDDAAVRTQPDSSTEAFMVEQILKAAAHGVHHQEESVLFRVSLVLYRSYFGAKSTAKSRDFVRMQNFQNFLSDRQA